MKTETLIDRYFESFVPSGSLPKTSVWVLKISLSLHLWLRNARTRHQLSELDEDALRDIGLCRGDAEAETHKHFYQN